MFFLSKLEHTFANIPPATINGPGTELFKAPIHTGTPSFIMRSDFGIIGCPHTDHMPFWLRVSHDHLIKNMVRSCGRLKYHLPA
jgi:hypothetical protein